MFSNALKSFTSNITSNYTLSPSPTSYSGPWKIYDAKKKNSNQAVSVFVFERKSLDSGGSSGPLCLRGSSSKDALRAAQEEAVDRLKKGASLLARLRHPSILELVEPVEETRGGGLMFATEPVMKSLAVLLDEDNKQEEQNSGGRYVVDDGNGGRRRREVGIDELEIQKGLLQVAKGLEFLHESAALIHGNLTPESIMLNVKSDWKLTSFSFTVTSVNPPLPAPYDTRLPSSVQLSLNYASPDLILDQNLTPSADLFSLGLLIVALYNNPHRSPLEANNSTSAYRRLLDSNSTRPNGGNNYLSSRPFPRGLVETLLSKLLTIQPANRVTARQFQQSPYFDNILVSTLRFLESLPAKTPSEKSAFMRGLPKVLPQFSRSVLEKKILPGLVEELRDGSMLALVLPNIFLIVEKASARLFSEKVLPRLKEVFTGHVPSTTEHKTAAAKVAERERESGREGGLTVLLSNLNTIKDKTTAKEFKEDILSVHHAALESPTHALQDLALRSIPTILPKLDFPTLKNDLFPAVASVFTKTSSLGIKIRGLEAFKVLCSPASAATSDAPELDKYTIQEKLIPLLRGIKTKEPAVSMAALDVFKVIGETCDREVVAMEILPCLWSMSFGPLLGVEQFTAFMEVVRQVSSRIEAEQIRKLQELRTEGESGAGAGDILSFGGMPGMSSGITGGSGGGDDNFENLVFGRGGGDKFPPANGGFDAPWNSTNAGGGGTSTAQRSEPKFSWSTPSSTTNLHSSSSFSGGVLQPQQQTRTMTPEAKMSFQPLTPTSASRSTALNSMSTNAFSNLNLGSGFGSTTSLRPQPSHSHSVSNSSSSGGGGIDWSAATRRSFPSTTSNTNTQASSLWDTPPLKPTQSPLGGGFKPPAQQSQQQNHPTILYGQTRQQPAPTTSTGAFSGFMIPPPPGAGTSNAGGGTPGGGFTLTLPISMNKKSTEKKGLDAYESLL